MTTKREPFFTAKDFENELVLLTHQQAAFLANAKVAPLIAENERLEQENLVLRCKQPALNDALMGAKYSRALAHRMLDENRELRSDKPFLEMEDRIHSLEKQIAKLTEQNRELESIVFKRVPKLEKILSIMTEQNREMRQALEFYAEYLDDNYEAYCAACAEYFPETGKEAPLGTHAREALAKCAELETKWN